MAKKKKLPAKVVSQTILADGVMDLRLETSMAEDVKPGQFVGIYPADKSMLLPRPISICQADGKTLRIVYRIVGKGTAEFALYRPGDYTQVLGVLGNGYDVSTGAGKDVVILGGGIGVPPMLGLAEAFSKLPDSEKPKSVSIVMGYRDNETFLSDEFEKFGKLYIATDDGSVGTHGNVIDALKANDIHTDVMYACGPMPMLKGIKNYAAEIGAKAYISLEERMACGVGACLGCVVKTKEVDHHSHVKNARICTDGPVFDAEDVDI